MPSYYRYRQQTKRWRARVKRDGIEYFLGYFATKQEALDEERAFDAYWPPKVRQPRFNAGDPVKHPTRKVS